MTALQQKILGILGGISYHSSADYYMEINKQIQDILPYKYAGHGSKCIMYSIDMEEHNEYVWNENWLKNNKLLLNGLNKLQIAGCDFIIIACNTAHMSCDYIYKMNPTLPILHIVDCIAIKLKQQNIKKIGLIGTKFSMNHGFYQQRLKLHNIECIIPKKTDDQKRIIYILMKELPFGIFNNNDSIQFLQHIIKNILIKKHKCKGCILGCTELKLIINNNNKHFENIPLFDSAQIHIDAAVQVQLGKKTLNQFLPKPLQNKISRL